MEVSAPIPPEQYALIWKWLNDYEKQTLDDYSPQTLEALIEKGQKDVENGGKGYAVWKDGAMLGAVWFDFLGDGMYSGHMCFERKALTHAEIRQAAREALSQLFSDGRKVYWQFLDSNRAFRIFLMRLGAKQEAHLTQATRCGGTLADMVIMASFPEAK